MVARYGSTRKSLSVSALARSVSRLTSLPPAPRQDDGDPRPQSRREQDHLSLALVTPCLLIGPDQHNGTAATNRGDIPTARAITERLVKIRQQATGKKGGASSGHSSIASSQTKGSSTTNTPRKNPSSPATKGTKTPASAANKKRKLATVASDAEDDDDDDDLTKTPQANGYGVPPLNFANIPPLTPTRNTQTSRSADAKTPTTSGRSNGVQHSRADSQATLSNAGTPTPRARRAASMKLSAIVKQEQEMEGSESGHGMESPAESDVSEYVV